MPEIKIGTSIGSNYEGYEQLVSIYHQMKEYSDTTIYLDFSSNRWFEANLCAVLGAICLLMEKNRVKIACSNMSNSLIDILTRNGFIGSNYLDLPDNHNGTVVSFQRFKHNQANAFNGYIKRELLSKSDFPKHSLLLGKRITESIFEIFENARTHGKCEFIHTCGQYYPRKSPARLDITIVDVGQTIHKNVNDFHFPLEEFDACMAIDWAIKYGNTTKIGRTGGLGLSLILEFIKLNNGVMQIISSNGYWEYRGNRVRMNTLKNNFPGTIVNIEFNFDDSCFYQLKSEANLTMNDIF